MGELAMGQWDNETICQLDNWTIIQIGNKTM